MARGDRSPRSEHADRIRAALIDTALSLFSTQGYDQTTTDEIAEAAGVSARTFFRYFPTKESVLFSGEYSFIEAFSAVYLAQDEALSDYDAMVESFAVLAPSLKRIRKRIAQYREAIASSVQLVGRERQNHEANGLTVAQVIATRRGLASADEECHILAEVGILLLERSINKWLTGPDPIDDVIRHEFAALPEALR
ncbi:TetR/AcrR family transcriptional regulator [Mycobacterium sp. E2497]|uniref:TetR/AcrR family transcriptional regulator n=1 Tax=Mycobacterium sp. E2497 TaxID=1834135 RepID=UPI0007FCAF1B|nr:TetR/AcrR family transcriptional regulator [Mycobacterium sp. E2497]OBI17579.1 TetR family transcriptional regulator [Mycobacterium sp. E2497]